MLGREHASDDECDVESQESDPLVACHCRAKKSPERRPSIELRGLAFGLFTESRVTLPADENSRSFAALCHAIYAYGLATDMRDCHHILHMLEDSGLVQYADENKASKRSSAALCCKRPMAQNLVFSDSVVNYQGDYEDAITKIRKTMECDQELEDGIVSASTTSTRLEFYDSIVLLTCGRYVALRRSRSVCHYWETIILFLVGALSWFTIWGIGIAGVLFAWWRDFGRRRAYLVLSGDDDEENPEMYNAEVFTIIPTRAITDETPRPQFGEFVYLRSAATGRGIHAPRDNLLQMGGNKEVRITAEGKVGDIHAGDHVFLVTRNGNAWGWRTRGGHLDRTHYLCTDAQSKVVFTLKKTGKDDGLDVMFDTCSPRVKHAGSAGIGNAFLVQRQNSCGSSNALPRISEEPTRKLHVSFIAYNVWMMPSVVTAFTQRFLKISLRKKTRARIIPEVLPPVDVVLLSEAFCHSATALLARGFKAAGYKFETPPLQGHRARSERKPLNGGVVVYSRFPIERCKMVAFGEFSSGDDAMADKGVLYVRIRKQNVAVHLFATHTQAWDTEPAKEVRVKQFNIIRDQIKSLNIPASEPVIIAGDLNVDRYSGDGAEYRYMLETLDAEDAFEVQEPKTYSFDAVNNSLASGGPSSDGKNGLLDYVLTSRSHLIPSTANVEVYPVKAPTMYTFQNELYNDLSDHYPVIAQFTFDAPVMASIPPAIGSGIELKEQSTSLKTPLVMDL